MMYNTWYGNSLGLGIAGMVGFGLLAVVVAIVVIVLKGYALWHAARRSEKIWFIILLVVNTVGILELVYLFFVVGKWHKFVDSGTPKNDPSPSGQSSNNPQI